MCLKGELGNLGEPKSFLVKTEVNGVPPERKTPGVGWYSHHSNEPETGYKEDEKTRYHVRTAKSERT
jgi:hypothetical protein